MPNYKNIIYWKWDYPIFEENKMENDLADIIKRSNFDFLYISFHHICYPFSDSRLLDLIRKCSDILISTGRELLLDIDVRNEGEEFNKAYPGHKGFLTRFIELDLDHSGKGSIEFKSSLNGRVGRKKPDGQAEYIINSWAFSLFDKMHFLPETLVNIKECTYIERLDDLSTKITVAAGIENAGKKVLLYPAIRHAIPDLFSPHLYEFYSSMFELVKDIPLGGAATDEWGYDLALEVENDHYFSRHFPFSPFMCSEYKKLTGRDMEEDMLYFLYSPSDNTGLSTMAVSGYLEVFRAKMKENNDWFYYKAKEVFGLDTFIGVHPTYWGDATDFYVDVILNGFDWWEVKRDYAQTDEWVQFPIRLALAHKWGGNVWYNMWYSGNTNIKETYYEETWINARYGGRTHYLGYECPNESGVFEMKQVGALEEMDEMEKEIKKLNDFQTSQPDSRVLVIFGMEAVSCWNICDPGSRIWGRNGGTLNKVLKFTKQLFDNKVLCDLIPSSEIANGSLELIDGKAKYGTQVYDAIIFLLPEGIRKDTLEFLQEYYKVNKNLIMFGDCKYFNNGEKATSVFNKFTDSIKYHLNNMDRIEESIEILRQWGVQDNVYENGCLYQDGSAIFTTKGLKHIGNELKVNAFVNGHKVEFEGEDFMAIGIDESGRVQRFAAGKCNILKIDGIRISELIF